MPETMSCSDNRLQSAYQHCMTIAQNHYENFPVASRLLNKTLRYPISAVYAFARSADDFADEGDYTPEQRLSLLDDYVSELNRIERDFLITDRQSYHSDNPIFIALADVIYRYSIPIQLFHDLLIAFKSDVTTRRYNSFEEILAYCRYSAAPVGRILLYLNNSASPSNLGYSDAICMGLQLINFYQDIRQDMEENDRLYLPLDELERFHVSIEDIRNGMNTQQTHSLIQWQIKRARELYVSGNPLLFTLSGRFALEIRTIYAGGILILDKLEQQRDSIYERPRLNKKDKLFILWRGFFPLK